MQPGSPNLSINLGKRHNQSPTSLFYNWVVRTGKIIIVSVELLTLTALGYRFYVDRQIVDLNDQIRKSQIFVEAQSKKENLYRSIQDRLAQIDSVQKQTDTKVLFLKDLISYLSSADFITTNLSVSDTSITIDGQAYSIFSLNSLIDNLKQNPNVSSISVDDLSSVDQGIRFKITTQLKS